MEPDVKLAWQEPFGDPEHCFVIYFHICLCYFFTYFHTYNFGLSEPAGIQNSTKDVEASHDQEPEKKPETPIFRLI